MIEDLENITVKELFQLEEETFNKYLKLQELLKPLDNFCGYEAKALSHLEFGQVANLKEYFNEPTDAGILDAFKIVFGVKERQYFAADVVSYFYALNWIKIEVEKLVALEVKMLSGKPDPLMEMAGADRLQVFKELPILKRLGKEYGQPPQVIETWKYNFIFSLLLLDIVETDVQENYNQLKKTQKPR